MARILLLAAFSAAWAFSQAHLSVPHLGLVRDASGRLLALRGLAGNFLWGEPVLEGVRAASSSGSWTLAKLETELLLLDADGTVAARWPAPPGSALFAFTASGEPALVYFSKTGELWRLAREGLQPLGDAGQHVVAIGLADAEHAVLIERSRDGLGMRTISLVTGSVEHEILSAESFGPALVTPDGRVVYVQGEQLRVRERGAPEHSLPMPAPVQFLAQISCEWIEARLEENGGRMALRLRAGDIGLYRLPEDLR